MLVVPQVGMGELFNQIMASLNAIAGAGHLKLSLYQNNYVPIQTTVIGNMTVATFTGYADKTLTAFNAAFLNSSGLWEADYPTLLSWTAADAVTPNTIYGYYLWDTVSNKLLWAERFAAPIDMTLGGETLNLLPLIQASSIF